MNDKHNPIALTIGRLQKDWVKLTMNHPEYRFFPWIVNPLIVGLLKLESSSNSDLSEFFVCWFTPFESINTFARNLIQDWTEMWEKDSSAKKTGNASIRQIASAGNPDDILKNTEIGVLAFHYQKGLKEAGEKEKANEIDTRMSQILGADWKDHIPDLAMEYADTMPDFEKNIEGDSQIKT